MHGFWCDFPRYSLLLEPLAHQGACLSSAEGAREVYPWGVGIYIFRKTIIIYMPVTFNVTVPEKAVYLLLAILLVCIVVIGVNAYTEDPPDPGHGGDTVWIKVNGQEKTLQDAIDDNDIVRPSWTHEPEWKSMNINLGSLPSSATTKSFDMPGDVPEDATEVLVYVWSYSGQAGSSASATFSIYTQDGSEQYIKRHYIRRYPQDAISYSSDNFWLPVTSERKIYAKLPVNLGSTNRAAGISVIGYRAGIGSLE